jgi:hypothetical protein
MTDPVPSALVTAGVAYARRDYEAAEDALMEALGGIRKERSMHRDGQEVRVYAE